MKRLTGTQVASLLAVAAAVAVAVFFPPLPPLLGLLHSEAWTRLVEWFLTSAAGLALLSWMGVTDMEFEISSSGIKARRIGISKDIVDALRNEMKGLQDDNARLITLSEHLRSELILRGGEYSDPSAESTSGENDA